MSTKQKVRLDTLVQQQQPHLTKNQIRNFILEGMVSIDGRVYHKPGHQVDPTHTVTLAQQQPQFVSRAGYKLAAALDAFTINVTDLVALDAGLSTGGFTDCLLQRGIKRVYGVDVGTDQVHEKIRSDNRVQVLEQTNLRTLETLPEMVDLVTLDLSFISILKVMPAIKKY